MGESKRCRMLKSRVTSSNQWGTLSGSCYIATSQEKTCRYQECTQYNCPDRWTPIAARIFQGCTSNKLLKKLHRMQ